MKLRRQLPAYSPIRLASLFAGTAGAVGFGDPVGKLRTRLTSHFGTNVHLLTDSGTSALRLAIRGALAMKNGDTVALPAYCCYDVATAAIGAGARVRLYDVDPATLGPDWASLDTALSAGASAVVVVHLYGVPVDVARTARMATEHGAIVIEDAAQGIGGSIEGRPLGSHGSLGVLSFGRGKGITGGGGGALLANDGSGRRALTEATSGDAVGPGGRGWGELLRLAAQWLLGRPSVYGLPASLPWLGLGETHYKEPVPPRGIARGAAAALLANWDVSLAEAEVRRANAARLGEALPINPEAWRAAPGDAGAGMLRYPVLSGDAAERDRTVEWRAALGAAAGYPSTLADVLGPSRAPSATASHPGANRLAGTLYTLPVHGLCTGAMLASLVQPPEHSGATAVE